MMTRTVGRSRAAMVGNQPPEGRIGGSEGLDGRFVTIREGWVS